MLSEMDSPLFRLDRNLLVDEFAAFREDEVAALRLSPLSSSESGNKDTFAVRK